MARISLYLGSILLAGCSGNYVKPVNIYEENAPAYETAKLTISIDPDVFEVVPPEFTNDVSAGAIGADAAARSMAYSPNFNPAATLVGTLVGLQLAKVVQEGAAIDKANDPVAAFQKTFRNSWKDNLMAPAVSDKRTRWRPKMPIAALNNAIFVPMLPHGSS